MSKAAKKFPDPQLDSQIDEFKMECEELSQRIGDTLAQFEKSGIADGMIASLYRDIHSLKGAAYLFGNKPLGDLAHSMETALEPIRDQKTQLTRDLIALLSQGLDLAEALSTSPTLENHGRLENLKAALAGRPGTTGETGQLKLPAEPVRIRESLPGLPKGSIDQQGYAQSTSVPTSPVVSQATQVAALGLQPSLSPVGQAAGQLSGQRSEPPPVQSTGQSPTPASSPELDSLDGKEASSSIRVQVSLLDKMMTLMGEMVLVRNQVLQYSSRADSLEFLNLSQRLDVVTSELQGEMMKTRMQPIGGIASKLQRVVRDLSRSLNKKIDIKLTGMETELDRTLLEAIKDPLNHIVRNACDHGIEAPHVRTANGKRETGTISVRAYHEGGQVIIEVADDGKGLERTRILEKAVESGLVTQEKANSMSLREVHNLVFLPGFSTAAQVTNVSGRGVGMDVVKSNVEKIGGIIEVSSQPLRGAVVRLKIPLTLAIVPAMIIESAGERYAIPQVKLVELVRAEHNGTDHRIEMIQGKPVYRLRGKILPLVYLSEVLESRPPQGRTDLPEVVNIVVLNAEKQYFGLIVDEIQDTADIVVKPLSRFLKYLSVYSGATVLGDGSVAFILDVLGIAQKQGLLVDSSSIDRSLDADDSAQTARTSTRKEYLLFKLDSPSKFAVPLAHVHRLEEFKAAQVEFSGAQRIVRYRNSILPLISLNDSLKFSRTEATATSGIIPVIVLHHEGRLYGIEVTEIIDVLSTEAEADTSISDRPGIGGNLIANDEVIVIVDTQWLLDETDSRLRTRTGTRAQPTRSATARKRILYAEDTAFVRRAVTGLLQTAGYDVTPAEDGEQAIQILKASAPGEFQLILSDIEMPKMGGLALASAVRQAQGYNNIPMIALTTCFEANQIEAGTQAGFWRYLKKLNEQELISTVSSLIGGQVYHV